MYSEIPVNAQKSSAGAKKSQIKKTEKSTLSVTKEDAKHHGKPGDIHQAHREVIDFCG